MPRPRKGVDTLDNPDEFASTNGVSAPVADPPAPEPQVESTPDVAASTELGESTEETTAQAAGGFSDWLANKNIRFDETLDDATALERLAEGYTQAEQLRQQLLQQQQAAAYYQHQLNLQRQQVQQPQVQQPAQTKAERPKWQPPEFDTRWEALLKRDEAGNIVAVPGAAPDLPQKYMAYKQWQAEQEQNFYKNPADFVWQAGDLEDRISERVNAIVEERIQQVQNKQAADAIWAQNAGWITEKDKEGNMLVNPQTGLPIISPEGQLAMQTTQALLSRGIPIEEAFAIGRDRAYAMLHQRVASSPAKPTTPEQAQQAVNLNFLKTAATRKPNQTGAVTRNEPAPALPGRMPDLGFMLRAAARENGSL